MSAPKFFNSRTELTILSAFFIVILLFAAGRRFLSEPAQDEPRAQISKTQIEEELKMPPLPPGQNDMLAAADVKRGRDFARFCTLCHTLRPTDSAKGKVGPTLFGVYGRKIASVPGYDYSLALQAISDRTWGVDNLDEWLRKPDIYAPGTKMTFNGMLDTQERMDLIVYLMTLK